MINEFKLVPANCRQRLAAEGKAYPRSSCASCGQFSPKWKDCDAILAAAPQPPALGGEPEVVAVVQGRDEHRELHWHHEAFPLRVEVGTKLIDRAHLAQLKGEIERLRLAEKNDAIAYKAAIQRQDELRTEVDVTDSELREKSVEIAKLNARCDELEGLVRKWRKEAGGTFAYMAQESDAALSKPAGSEQA